MNEFFEVGAGERLARDAFARREAHIAERLERLEQSSNPELKNLVERAKGLSKRAERFPELARNVRFQQALRNLRLGQLQAMIETKEREAAYINSSARIDHENRKAIRVAAEIDNLKQSARKSGARQEEVAKAGTNTSALRALVQRARTRQELYVKAARYDCVLVVAPYLEDGSFEAAKVVICTREQMIESAKKLGIEAQVRNLLLRGEGEQAEHLIRSVRYASAMEQFRCRQAGRIEKALPIMHANLLQLLAETCSFPYDSRGFRQAKRQLDGRLFELGV